MANKKKSPDSNIQAAMRSLMSMDRVLADSRLDEFRDVIGHDTLKELCREALNGWRNLILAGEVTVFDEHKFFGALLKSLRRRLVPSLRRVINATGVVVHTNLGRSCLADEAVEAVAQVAKGYNTLEYNLDEGHRGQRNSHVEWLLCRLTGAEAAVVVNNNAGAVLLVLAALAGQKEAVVSRGELVEIGGSFRIPDIMSFAGTRLHEIGCTNRTHLADYENAINEDTAMLLKVHPSNFRISGFVTAPEREEIARLAHDNGLLMVEDLGSGILLDAETLGIEGEPTVNQCLQAGVDVVTFSGDKILGGPQIGGIVGSKKIIDKIRKYPLLRALRCDKMTLAAMESTLRLYLSGDWKKVPTPGMIAVSPEELKLRADDLKKQFDERCAALELTTRVVEVDDAVGGGAYPERVLDGWAVGIRMKDSALNAGILQERLRSSSLPVVAGARNDELLFHVRTLRPGDEEAVIVSLTEAVKAAKEAL